MVSSFSELVLPSCDAVGKASNRTLPEAFDADECVKPGEAVEESVRPMLAEAEGDG